MVSQRKRGLARWLVVGLSGLATAGFLGAIINQAGAGQPISPPQIQDLSVVATPKSPASQSINSSSTPTNTQPQVDAQSVARAPRFRTRGS
jgi:hypothetical protein